MQARAASGVADNFNGVGRIQFPNGDVYEGQFKQGKMEGRGVLTTVQGNIY